MNNPKPQKNALFFRWRWWLLAFFLGCAVAAVAQFPAKLVSGYAQLSVQKISRGRVQLLAVNGTIWNSHWRFLVDKEHSLNVSAYLSFAPLFAGIASLKGDFSGSVAQGTLELSVSRSEQFIKSARLTFKAQTLTALLFIPPSKTPAQANGDIALRINVLRIENAWPQELDAQIFWSGGQVKSQERSFILPAITVRPVLDAEQIVLEPVTESVDGVLARVELKKDRKLHVQVYQRGAQLVDTRVTGAANKVVFEMAQPW